MNYTKYYEARNIVTEILKKDLLGPLTEDEIINDYPVSFYIVGKLYPQDCRFYPDRTNAEDNGVIDDEQTIPLTEWNVPSSIGISFVLKNSADEIQVSANAALYHTLDELDQSTKKPLWKRQKLENEKYTVHISDLKESKKIEFRVDEGLKLLISLHKIYSEGEMTISVSLINTFKQSSKESRFWVNQHTYFQPKIEVEGKATCFTDIRKNIKINNNSEAIEMDMLYSQYKNYVTGHGCASDFKIDKNRIILRSLFLPEYELCQMMPRQNTNSKILSMKYLASLSQMDLIKELNEWLDEYNNWIKTKINESESLPIKYQDAAKSNLDKCTQTCKTIRKSIKCLLESNEVYKAFVYANEAMFLQRRNALENKGLKINEEQIRWYPFQLAFFLQEVVSFACPDSMERAKVDLLWFPTGGGKTEAYLGIAAFVIFLRRLRNPDAGDGVAIIMRYTLRLLTFQQFERASTMICACELLRSKYKIPGGNITIGLWVGRSLTPNTIEKADNILKGYPDPDYTSSNPKQIEKCPWCGNDVEYSCNTTIERMHIKCTNPACKFHNGLPIFLIDEEIYKYRPSFLVATIDKFAQVAYNEQTFRIFGKGTHCIPPELVIQDELHLISGPLGTITGIYEAAFKKICMHNGVCAKIIASTATIKNAKEQIKSLYASDFTQFPPQGIDVEDSYFAVKSTRHDKPARLYMGGMGVGTSATNVMVRVMAATLFATRYLEALDYSDDIIDSFWTITGYFNTLRELGGSIIRVLDNVQDRFGYLKETRFKDSYPLTGGQTRYDKYIELTSREKSENIGRIIQKDLARKYSKLREFMPIDFILASNMISVGIDIGRLNTMLVVGQPKTTAEYIQATSRVGRETPGLVFTMYNYMRSRDKSHFEQFNQYHEAFYKYVEATSVTPFSERARDRVLQTLYIILCRYFIDELSSNECAGKYNRSISGLQAIREYIFNYVFDVDKEELENVKEEITDIEEEWESLALVNPKMRYNKTPYQKDSSLYEDEYKENSRFRVLNSMRSVERTVQVVTRE